MGEFFDVSRINEGISAVCDAMDSLDLTLVERWWVCHHVAISARAILSEKSESLSAELDKLYDLSQRTGAGDAE